MFYGIPEGKLPQFEKSLQQLSEVYPGQIVATDMLIAFGKTLTFRFDSKFQESLQDIAETDQEKSLFWRLHTLVWAAQHCLHLEGDFVECGVLRGFCSAVVCKATDFHTLAKSFYLYDTFSGLPEETSTEAEREAWSGYKSYDSQELLTYTRNRFSSYPNVNIIPGIVPYSFEEACPEKIAYLHIDMNSAQAEILALEHLFDRVVPGGMIILDDFGWLVCLAQAVEEDNFMRERGYNILELPTGQGLVVKR